MCDYVISAIVLKSLIIFIATPLALSPKGCLSYDKIKKNCVVLFHLMDQL